MLGMSLRFQREALTPELIDEAMPLLQANMAETGTLRDAKPGIDVDAYVHLEQAGAIRFFTARDDAGRLCGYTAMFVRRHPHRVNDVEATQDTVYLHPDHRHGLAGVRLIQHADDSLAAEGVRVVYRQSTVHRPLDVLLERMGYRQAETLYARRLN